MGISMIVKKAFRPNGSNSPLLQPGSPFEASGESLARTYRAMGWAEDAPAVEKVSAPVEPTLRFYERKVMGPAVEPVAEVVWDPPPKRKYQRRDMTAKTED